MAVCCREAQVWVDLFQCMSIFINSSVYVKSRIGLMSSPRIWVTNTCSQTRAAPKPSHLDTYPRHCDEIHHRTCIQSENTWIICTFILFICAWFAVCCVFLWFWLMCIPAFASLCSTSLFYCKVFTFLSFFAVCHYLAHWLLFVYFFMGYVSVCLYCLLCATRILKIHAHASLFLLRFLYLKHSSKLNAI